MEVLRYPCKLECPAAVALGQFDGVHSAHCKVIKSAVGFSKRMGLVPCVFTFSNNPGKIHKDVLTTEDEKRRLLRECGAGIMVNTPFEEVKDFSAEEFVCRVLRDELKAKAVFCGFNYRFGKGAQADVSELSRLCEEQGIFVTCVDEVDSGDCVVSSTAIRSLLAKGEVLGANKMLGREYALCGKVIHGNGIGRTISTPTLNVDVSKEKFLPRFGVYACEVSVDGVSYKGVCNIGNKPTVGSDVPTVEAYLFDVQGDFYYEFACVKLLGFIRDEVKFDDVNALRQQIKIDIEKANEIFAQK